MRKAKALAKAAEKQRGPYEGKGFPEPGEDPELVSIVKDVLGDHLRDAPTQERWQLLVQRIRQYLALENKRKNLVGEGFEDVLAEVVRRACRVPSLEVHARRSLQDLPGFNRARRGDKPNKVDVAVVRPGSGVVPARHAHVSEPRGSRSSYGEVSSGRRCVGRGERGSRDPVGTLG